MATPRRDHESLPRTPLPEMEDATRPQRRRASHDEDGGAPDSSRSPCGEHTMAASICGGCNCAIQDQYMFHVLDKSWHAGCLRCVDCKTPQTESCFFRDGLILCRTDFTRRFGTRCAGCNAVLERQDLVRRARDLVFHVRCFQCAICQKTLDTGEQLYVVSGNRFICKDDYLSSSVGSEEGASTEDLEDEVHDDDDVSNGSRSSPRFPERVSSAAGTHHQQLLELEAGTASGGSGNDDAKGDDGSLSTKRRGPRTTIKSKQLETLKAAFLATPKPTRHMREQLSNETGLSMRVIQVWFQNRRSKERRMKQTRLTCGPFRPTRRSRGGAAARAEELNSVFCDVIEPVHPQATPQPDAGFYAPMPAFFPQGDLYSSGGGGAAVESQGGSGFGAPGADSSSVQQLEALAAVVHVSSEYHLDEALLQSGLGNAALSVW